MTIDPIINLEKKYAAKNYEPFELVLVRGEGVFVWDNQGKRYLDMMSAYSAVSHGHCHPRLVKVLTEQARTLAVISRAYYSEQLGRFLQKACELTHQDMALPMNTGAEAVETAVKAARKWAYEVKGVAKNQAEIIVCNGNFHGRTLAAITMSSHAAYRKNFGPFPSGFIHIPYDNPEALEAAITDNTAAFIVEPIQGEAGIVIPQEGYLKQCAEICRKHNILLICDEIQTGLGRTGKFLASEHDNVIPDGLILGKALGGGLLPVSLFLAKHSVIDCFKPGDHGSTFGGSPLASAVAEEALNVLIEEELVQRSEKYGSYVLERLKRMSLPYVTDIRGKGLFIGLEVDPFKVEAKEVCQTLLNFGSLSKDTHKTVIRIAPPLVINEEQSDFLVESVRDALNNIASRNA